MSLKQQSQGVSPGPVGYENLNLPQQFNQLEEKRFL